MQEDDGNFWVFGYGSLIWRPGFDYIERRPAHIHGYHRALCVLSHVHRGTPERPGLVLGLDKGGGCKGVAYRVASPMRATTMEYLRAREQATLAYRETSVTARLDNGRTTRALTYVADIRHPQYARRLPREQLLALVHQGHGISGPNPEYIVTTHLHLAQLGIVDPTLAWLYAQLTV